MKKRIISLYLLILSSLLFSQEQIIGEREILYKINLSSELLSYSLISPEDVADFPGSPIINNEGEICFLQRHNNKFVFLRLDKGNFLIEEKKFNFNYFNNFYENFYVNQNGVIKTAIPTLFFKLGDKTFYRYDLQREDENVLRQRLIDDNIDYKIEENRFINKTEIFSEKNTELPEDIKYIGNIKSGHSVWVLPKNVWDDKRIIYINNEKGIHEVILSFDLKPINDKEERQHYSTWSLGNWGEIYALIPPIGEIQETERFYDDSPKSGEAELIVIRNHLKYFGILNDDRIRLRKGPGTDTESLGTYPIKTGFRIIEDSGVKQTIDGVTDIWVKVRLLDGTEGYFFGQYVQNLYDGPGTPLPWPNVADWD